MTYNPDIHHRRSIRLKGYDYSREGAYFVTICINNRECILGKVSDGKIVKNVYGEAVESVWNEMVPRFPSIILDAFIVMPNHVHGIIILHSDCRDAACCIPDNGFSREGTASSAPTLGKIIRAFKSISAISVNKLSGRSGQFWQKNYYEHIVRNEEELNRLREYVINNPLKWHDDEYFS